MQRLFPWLCLVGCSSGPTELSLSAMEPSTGDGVAALEVTIYGRGFVAAVDERFDGDQAVDTAFEARLGSVELMDVRWIDDARLSALVPAGLAPGAYDLVVTGANGARDTLTNAFEVAATGGGITLRTVSLTPAALTADGTDEATWIVHAQDASGAGLAGLTLVQAAEAGVLGAPSDEGGGDYAMEFVAPATVGDGVALLSVTLGDVVLAAEVRLHESCAGSDFVVDTVGELGAAVTAAGAAGSAQEICVSGGATLVLSTGLALGNAFGVTLRGEAGAVLSGANLDSGETGLVLTAGPSVLRNLVLEDFEGTAVELDGNAQTVRQVTFSDCRAAIRIEAAGATVGPGNLFLDVADDGVDIRASTALVTGNTFRSFGGSSVGVRVSSGAVGATVRRNVFVGGDVAIRLQDATGVVLEHNTVVDADTGVDGEDSAAQVQIRNSIFTGLSEAIDMSDDSFVGDPSFNAFFAVGTACADCDLGVGNRFDDPLFMNAAAHDFRLRDASPCIDAGTPTTEAHLGVAPDLGAFEMR